MILLLRAAPSPLALLFQDLPRYVRVFKQWDPQAVGRLLPCQCVQNHLILPTDHTAPQCMALPVYITSSPHMGAFQFSAIMNGMAVDECGNL